MINSLTETNIGRYLEFRAINKLFTRTGDKIEQVSVVYLVGVVYWWVWVWFIGRLMGVVCCLVCAGKVMRN